MQRDWCNTPKLYPSYIQSLSKFIETTKKHTLSDQTKEMCFAFACNRINNCAWKCIFRDSYLEHREITHRENSLFHIEKMSCWFLETEKICVPYLTPSSTLVPYMTFVRFSFQEPLNALEKTVLPLWAPPPFSLLSSPSPSWPPLLHIATSASSTPHCRKLLL